MTGDQYTEICLPWHRRCLAADTFVTMADGSPKRICDVSIGDEILTWVNGKYVTDRVTNVVCNGIRDCVTVRARGFLPITATPDHEFLFNKRGRKHYFAELQHGVSHHELTYAAGGVNAGTVHDPALARFLGYMITDGSCNYNQQPKFTNVDQAVLDKFSEVCLKAFPKIKQIREDRIIRLSNGTRGGGEILNPVKQYLGACNKSQRTIPDIVWRFDDESLREFFAAVMDGDGSFWTTTMKGMAYETLTAKIHVGLSYEMAVAFFYALNKLGIRASRLCLDKNCWTVCIDVNEQANKVAALPMVHQGKINRGLPYKIRKTLNNACSAHYKTEVARTQEVWDITTAKHHSFIANGCIVHNCGKDEMGLHAAAVNAVRRVGNYWHMLPKSEQCRRAIWDAINPRTGRIRWKDAFPPELIKRVDSQAMRVEFINGSSWQLLGSDNYDNIVGAPPVWIFYSEAALANPQAFGYFRPILRENHGRAVYVSSVRGRNHFYNLYQSLAEKPDGFRQHLSALDTGVFTKEELAEERRAYIALYGEAYGIARFEQEYLSNWNAAVIGAVFARELEQMRTDGRITNCVYDNRYPVRTSWDLGVSSSDPTIILFWQQVGNEHRLIDWHYDTHTGMAHFAKVLASKPYFYACHVAPHDIANREWGSGKSRIMQAREFGINFFRVPRVKTVTENIGYASTLLDRAIINVKEDRLDGHDDCNVVLDALLQYHFKYDEQRKIASDRPEHDWTSHYADAVACYGHYIALEPSGLGVEMHQSLQGTYAAPATSNKWEITPRRSSRSTATGVCI